MAYNVTVIDTEENTTTIEVEGDDYILDKMEEEGIDAPFSCRAGACSTCAAKITEGTVNQEDINLILSYFGSIFVNDDDVDIDITAGDVSGDGIVNVVDIVVLVNYILGNEALASSETNELIDVLNRMLIELNLNKESKSKLQYSLQLLKIQKDFQIKIADFGCSCKTKNSADG